MSSSAQAAWLRQDLAVIVIGGMLLALWELSGLDLPVMRLLGDRSGFALQDAFVTRVLLHEAGRWISYALFAALVVNALRPLPLLPQLPRRQRWGWLAVTLLGLGLIAGLKALSLTSCPWDLVEFGGKAHYVSHLTFGVADGGPGRCFPAGHPSGGFGFVAGYFALRPASSRAAHVWLAGVMVLGLLFGFGQTLRGAHYPSHTLYTAWICWTFSSALFQLPSLLRRRA